MVSVCGRGGAGSVRKQGAHHGSAALGQTGQSGAGELARAEAVTRDEDVDPLGGFQMIPSVNGAAERGHAQPGSSKRHDSTGYEVTVIVNKHDARLHGA